MATILDKALVRESTVKVGGREVIVTLNEDQTVSMKLKGMKSGAVSITIADLYEQLTGGPAVETSVVEVEEPINIDPTKLDKTQKDNPTMSLYELRTKFATTPMSFDMHSIFDGVIVSCIKGKRGPVLEAERIAKEKAEKRT